jgi:hypothetical protein
MTRQARSVQRKSTNLSLDVRLVAEAKNLEAISKAIDQHNANCEWPAVAIEMNPFEVERLGWDSIRGLPVRSNPALGTGEFTVVCAREEGEPETASMPGCWRKRNRWRAGWCSAVRGSQDHTAETSGAMKWLTK